MKRKLISSLLCLCMLFSLLPTAAFAGDETDGTEASTPAIASVGYAEVGSDANTAISKAINDARGNGSNVNINDCDKQTMWVVFSGLSESTNYKFTLKKDNAEITTATKAADQDAETLANDSKVGPGLPFTVTGEQKGVIGIYWTFNQDADVEAGTVANKEIAVGDYTIQLQKEADATLAEEQATATFEDVTDVKKDISIGSITIKSSDSDNSAKPTYYMGGTKVTLTPPAPEAGKAFDGWTASDNSTVPANNEVTVGNTAVTYTAQWKDAATDVLQAGFSWKAADADKGLNDAFAKIGVTPTNAISDSLDQTVWVLAQRPAASDSTRESAPAYYWYTVENTTGTTKTTFFQGPITIAEDKQAAGSYVSFLSYADNTNYVAPADGKLTVKLYALDTAPTQGQTPTLPTDSAKIKTVEIDSGANPDKISAVTPNVSEGTVKVEFNSKMSGRYYIELMKDDVLVEGKTINTDCNRAANPDGSFTEQIFSGVTFAAGKYTVNLYPRLGGTQDATGKAGTTPIDSKDFTLDGTINSVDVFVGDSTTPSTAITAEVDATAKTITLKGNVVNPASMTLKVVAQTGVGEVANNDVEVTYNSAATPKFSVSDETLTVLGQEYEIKVDLTAVDTPVAPPATSAAITGTVPEGKEETVLAAANSVTTTSEEVMTDLATAAAVAVDAVKVDESDTSYDASTAATKLGTALETTVNEENVKVVVQPYLDIAVDNYTESDSSKVLSLDISAKYRVVATTADVANDEAIVLVGDSGTANAVDITKAGIKTTMDVETAITIQLDLPTGFVNNTNPLFVKHHDKHYHQGTVAIKASKDTDTAYTLTFTSNDGLSPFSIDTSASPAAQIEETGTYFDTLKAAVEAAENGDTIIVLTNPGTDDIEAAIDSNKTIGFKLGETLVSEGQAVTVKINGTEITIPASGTEVTHEFTKTDDSNNPENPGTPSSPGGSGGGVSSNVTVSSATNGKVTVTPTAPSKGATVTINLTPDAGYQVGTVTVTDKDGNTVELTKVSDTQYTFVMPDGKVTVKATFTKVETPSDTGFTDVAADAYYADAVKWAVDKGITNGLTATTFGPNNSCTRGQMVTFLWRAAGSPAAAGTNSFSDVASGEYYYDAVLWAVEEGITNGTSATTFSPNATVTRGQTVTFLYRYAGSPAVTGDNSFSDVASGEFYADAVTWAVAEGITNGTSATTFSPASNCTRGQIVTFLYRQIAE